MTAGGARRWRLVVADMDGTLVHGTTALAHLAAWLGHAALVAGVEDSLAGGHTTDRDVADAYAQLYRGVTLADARRAMAGIPHLADIAHGVALLRAQSVECLIATVSWRFAAQELAERWGCGDVCGVDLDLDPAGRFTGRVAQHCTPADKVAFVAAHCARRGIGMDQVVAVGDSRSDLPLFAAAGFSVALNATPDARAAATVAVDAASFLPALRAVPGLLPRP